LILESVYYERRRSLQLNIVRSQSTQLFERKQTPYATSTVLLETQHFIQQFSLFQFLKTLLAVDLQLSELSCSHAGWRHSWHVSVSSCLSKNI